MDLIEHLLMKLISFGGIGFLIYICSRNKYIFKIGDIEVFENKTLLETNKYIVFYKETSSASQKEILDKIHELIRNLDHHQWEYISGGR